MTKYHRVSGFCSVDALLTVLRARKVGDQSASMVGFREGALPGLQLASFSLLVESVSNL